MMVMFHSNIGYAFREIGEMRKSNMCYEKSLNLSRDIQSTYNIALSFHNLGVNYQYLEEYKTSKTYYEASLELYETIFQQNHGHILKVKRGLIQVEEFNEVGRQ